MIRFVLGAALLAAAAALPASAQIAGSTAGNVGSATLRNGYPANGGAFALPSLATSIPLTTPTTGTATNRTNPATAASASSTTTAGANATSTSTAGGNSSTTTAGGGSGFGGGRSGGSSAGRGQSGTGATGAAAPSAVRSGGNWVLCPSGSGLAPFLEGTSLSCAPD